MNVPQDDLNTQARAFLRIHQANADAAQLLRRGDVDGAQTALEAGRGIAWRSMQAAVRMGAERPAELAPRREISIFQMDTPANRRLLDILREVVRAAEERDKETGDYPDGIAEILAHFAAGVAEEVEGPARTAGRE